MQQFDLHNNPWFSSWDALTSSADWKMLKTDFLSKYQELVKLPRGRFT
ncbi:class I poly(R)-hydroxyalkanoic acid synthase [Oligella ureolytica]